MPLFSSLRDYAKRHRKGLLLTAAIGGGSYLVGRYATSKLREMQEKATTERVAKENLKRRFQQNQNDCVFTVLSLLPTLSDQILYEMNIEAAWAKLQESRKLEKKQEKLRREKEAAAEAAVATEISDTVKNDTAEDVEKAQANGEMASSTQKNDEPKINGEKEQGNTIPSTNTEEKESVETKTTQESQSALDASVGSLTASGYSEDGQNHVPGLLDKKAKYVLWEDIKISSFTRSLTSIYSLTLLTLLTHIQLNLLGRFTYVWSVSVLNQSEPTIRLQRADEEPEGGFLDPQTERMFLSASWWLLHRGWRACAERVKKAVDEVVGSIPLKRIITYQDATQIMNKLRRHIEFENDGTTPTSFRLWMLPETDADTQEFLLQAGFAEGYPKNDASQTVDLKRLLDETKDYIDSPDFVTVLSTCLDEVFAIFDHQAFAKTLLPDGGSMEFMGQRIYEVHENEAAQVNVAKKVTLANLLPSISRQAHLVISGNEYLNAFTYIKELHAFSAMIYTQYDETILNN